MVACLVRAGVFPSWELAFEAARRQRRCVKLNKAMRHALAQWQATYGTRPLEA